MYVRMSTDLQQYSIENQSEAIQKYADEHSFRILKRFVDAGKSGLTLRERPALRNLLVEAISGNAEFRHVLVYDVSRWGRFQDADESAYYEFLCRRSGVQLHYCMEQFSNEITAYSSLIKAIKRMMAGEYSRELSVKTFQGACRLALMGFRQGGAPGYGLRRIVVDVKGNGRTALKPGERKTVQSHRVLLVPGPGTETSVVREIFELFVKLKSEQAIADLLNERKVRPEESSRWTHPRWTRLRVHQILTNPKYVGTNVYNRKTTKLGQTAVRNPESAWIRKAGAFKPVISLELFEKAHEIIRRRSEHISNDEILDTLRRLLKRKGRLTMRLISKDKEVTSTSTIFRRFGSLTEVYKVIGYEAEKSFRQVGPTHLPRVRAYGSKSLRNELQESVSSHRLPVEFTLSQLRRVCPGWAFATYKAFVGTHSTSDTSLLLHVCRGVYRLNSRKGSKE
jgi:DNA invertase Pin-like site-specific DNA recombinase